MRPLLHIFLHFLIPLAVPYVFRMKNKGRTFLILCSTMLVDLDHLLADPIYDPNRASIGFHPLHSYLAIGIYACLLFVPKARLVAIGLLIHMGLDAADALFMH